ncbi:hypothetical protein [Sinomicrobium soli]|uniref:hypothetical protein n=1 Tax=Sinomicrobium sp. N-1-3-6 TaxID=2219864 RepID=UPI000DCE6949|nr:hypothetical protein [Sinomicrobium sp. N-1-3-6]RAV27890.1 hypothetical protein DN748_16655 [Sinomicrobium sp. N-1-3-6]
MIAKYSCFFLIFSLFTYSCHGTPKWNKGAKNNVKNSQEGIFKNSKNIKRQDSLSYFILQSVHIIDISRKDGVFIDSVEEERLLKKIKGLVKEGSIIKEEDILMLVQRDGSGDGYITSKLILEFLLENYKEHNKQKLLDNLLLESIQNTGSNIVKFLVNAGAHPDPDEIKRVILGWSPDYSPSYKTLKIVVDQLHFDLHKECNITLLWWILQGSQFSSDSKIDVNHIRTELATRKEEAFLPCNENQVFDPDFFAVGQSAYDLGIVSDNPEIADIFKGLK